MNNPIKLTNNITGTIDLEWLLNYLKREISSLNEQTEHYWKEHFDAQQKAKELEDGDEKEMLTDESKRNLHYWYQARGERQSLMYLQDDLFKQIRNTLSE